MNTEHITVFIWWIKFILLLHNRTNEWMNVIILSVNSKDDSNYLFSMSISNNPSNFCVQEYKIRFKVLV